jgi:hypothetical protein
MEYTLSRATVKDGDVRRGSKVVKYCVTILVNNICTLLIHIADWSLHSWLHNTYVYTCIQSTAINYPSTVQALICKL